MNLRLRNFLVFFLLIAATALIGCQKEGQIEVEIFYLPHQPAQSVVAEANKVLADFQGLSIRKYDLSDQASANLLATRGITDHTPVAIFINGKNKFRLEGREVHFRNFPLGSSFVPEGMGGDWSYQDLKTVLENGL